jgi:hypothetical protein
MPALVDLIDSNLQLWHGTTHLQSPGYALLEGKSYRFGQGARESARLRPRDINTRYWWQLSTEALQPAMGSARHTADLAHAHLKDLHQSGGNPAELLLAVPGTMQRDQLSLLLGIVQQCPFEAVGLVNRSVALGSLFGGGERIFHLEIQLHQAVISELAESGGKVDLRRTVPLPGCGLLQLQERLVEIIAAAFIRQTRFDPRRKAATEQQLYDALPDALRALFNASETNLEVNGYRARISASELEEAGQRLFDSATDTLGALQPGDCLIADPITGLLPGITRRFPQAEILAEGTLRDALEQHGDRLIQREQALSFITSLPCLASPIPADTHTPVEPPQATEPLTDPTHLLRGARAERLVAAGTNIANGWSLVKGGDGWRLAGNGPPITVNGQDHDPGKPLACGDRIFIAPDQEFRLIEVTP